MKDDFVREAEKWLCVFVNTKLGDEPWSRHSNIDTVHPQYVSDATAANFYVDNSASVYIRKDYKELPAIRLGNCHCLICGNVGLKLICSTCRDTHFVKCKHCHGLCSDSNAVCEQCKSRIRFCEDCGKEFLDNRQDVHLCHDCSYQASRCLICGHTVDWVNKHPGKHEYETYGVVPILGGVFVAHKQCVEGRPDGTQKMCVECGRPVTSYAYKCAFCSMISEGKRTADAVIRKVNQFRKRLAWDTPAVDLTLGPNAVPVAYAMAA